MSGSSPTPDGQPRPPRDEAVFSAKAESVTPDNRRRAPRFSVDLDVTMSSDHNFYAGFAENISSGGLFVATYVKRPKGDRLDIVINIPGHPEPIRVVGEVRWSRDYSEHSNVPPGLGVRFVDLPERDAKAIEMFLKDREPLFYDDD
ncbi:MAG TPA: TIGR02266 family protein [Polyangiaceae bacterium]|nr:TIGR02266 family protein [Polyangiaceae bacterium]